MMNKTGILSALIVVVVSQISCKVTEQPYPTSMPTPIYAQVPSILMRGNKYTFSFEAIPEAECHAGVAFYDTNDKWVIRDLATIQAGENGICQWTWEIPQEAKDGIGEFRGYMESEEEKRNIFPATFCIESCPP